MAPSNVRIIVADDHEVVRSGLVSLPNGTDIEIVAEASTAKKLLVLYVLISLMLSCLT